uniref:Lipoprotein n=2 Tax=unclassified Prevotella TaxID=2638335 RepID=A0AB33J7Z2_9BACT
MKKIWILLLLAPLLAACGVNDAEQIEEDYEKLFPFKKLEQPPVFYEDMVPQLCDPRLALEAYRYPGVEITENPHKYEVTLECKFWEKDRNGELVKEPTAEYIIKYIDADKQLKKIVCKNKYNKDDKGQMKNGQRFRKRIKVSSGYPMYLCVIGRGPRSSGVSASIKAVSDDKLVITPELKTEQYQNDEGPNELKEPYCNYIILP